MRVTNSMMVTTLLNDLNTNLSKLTQTNAQLSSGKRINKPSDDPVGLVDSLRLRTNLGEFAQFKTNAEEAKSWLEATDSSLNEFQEVLHRVRELSVRGSNGTMSPDSIQAIEKEISQLKDHIVQIANTKQGDRYLFSGTMTRTLPFDSAGVYQGNTGSIAYEVGVGVKVPINVSGSTAFGSAFAVLGNLITDLSNGNAANIGGPRLAELDGVLDNLLEVRADTGARVNRLEFSISRIDSQTLNMTDLLSKTEDVDMAQLIIELKTQENVYRASLSAGAKIVQPSLIDFLR